MTENEHYLVIIRPPRSNFANSMTPEESKIMEEHFLYLQSLLEANLLLLVGPCVDGAFGIIILNVNSYEKALELIEKDPSVKSKLISPEIHPFRVSLQSK